jgi:hydrogenase 3 maturation protease
LVQALEEELKREDLIFIQGGMHPEAWAERIVQFKPSKLVVVEAMDMGAEVGEVRLLNPSQLKGFFSTTHRPSLALLLSYIGSRCEVKLLGVQVASLEFGEGMSKPIRSKLEELRERVRELILDLLGE